MKVITATDSKPERGTPSASWLQQIHVHRTAMKKLRLHQAVDGKIKTQLLSETKHQVTKCVTLGLRS
jgi:hypothetical protein